ncbi:NADPH-dependent FMN reductase [Paenarthrobacter nicotinovorans]|uniref:NADPH-dependent FMN reductase n=1 Tax=Paenarthrobacter nicotinovorans TaxID=29320 RepID=UPI0037F52478
MGSILMISGSVRDGSVNSAVIATAAELLPYGTTAVVYDAIGDLPHFNPDSDRDPLPRYVSELRRQIEESSALFFSTPEYAGAMPGALKNLLKWTVGGAETSGKPAGWINPSSTFTHAAGTYASLRTVLDYTGANVVEQACVDIPVPRALVGKDGIVHDEEVRSTISRTMRALIGAIESGKPHDPLR